VETATNMTPKRTRKFPKKLNSDELDVLVDSFIDLIIDDFIAKYRSGQLDVAALKKKGAKMFNN